MGPDDAGWGALPIRQLASQYLRMDRVKYIWQKDLFYLYL